MLIVQRILWSVWVHYRVHKSLPFVPNLSQLIPVHASRSPLYFLNINFPVTPSLCLHLLRGPYTSGFPAKILSASVPSPARVTWPTRIITLASLICGSFLFTSQLKLRRLPKAHKRFTANILCNFAYVTALRVYLLQLSFCNHRLRIFISLYFIKYSLHWGTEVAQWLRCYATNRKVAGSIPDGVIGLFIDIKSFRSHYGPGVDSASNRNEYQEYFLGVKAAGA